ncbi:hypothetical protein [Bacillus sp. NPDC077027]|uniref:hypothetical protein n=1 Tax=Bacillus sp. NPDC077027 TaxID=3390548 RepID=UPI003D089A39
MEKKILVGILGITLMLPLGAEAAYKSYSGYVLGGGSKNNNTCYHSKQTLNQHIINTVKNFQNDTTANF